MQLWQTSPRLKMLQSLARLPHYQRCLLDTSACRYLNHYEVLGLQPDCSQTDVKDAFVRLSKLWHPDRQSSELRETQHGKFVELNTAYSVLSKPQLRAQYDAQLRSLERGYYKAHDNYTVYTNAPRQKGMDEDAFFGRHRDSGGTEGRSYYGVPWIKKRLDNSTVVSIVVAFMVLGMVVHFYIARLSRDHHVRRADLRDLRIASSYRAVRERALGSDRQAQLLRFQRELNQTPDTQLMGDQERERNSTFLRELTESGR